MQSELDIIDSLNALGYQGSCLQQEALIEAVKGGLRNANLKDLICWLAAELHVLRKTDEIVSKEIIHLQEFGMELCAFLKELGCYYNSLVTGTLEGRFNSKQQCLLLLEFLISELMTTKMHIRLRPKEKNLVISKTTTNTALALEQLVRHLNVGKVPANISLKAFFDNMNVKLEQSMRKSKPGVLSEPMMHMEKPLKDTQWLKLDVLCTDLENEYNLRRQMLLTRLEVTVQSFNWSDRLKGQENQLNNSFEQQILELKALSQGGEQTNLTALLAARKDLAIVEKTSCANVRKNTACKIQKHVMGNVPDRGGRAHEHAPPPPEMPAWQQQRAPGPNRGGGRGGGRGGYGNRGGRGGTNNNYQAQPQRQQYQSEQQAQKQMHGRYDNNQEFISGRGRVQGAGWTQGGPQDREKDEYRRGGGGGSYNRGYNNNYNRGNRR